MDAGKFYSDQTGSFPVTSSEGVKCVFILYYYDANEILSEYLKSRTGNEILYSHNKYYDYLKEMEFNP